MTRGNMHWRSKHPENEKPVKAFRLKKDSGNKPATPPPATKDREIAADACGLCWMLWRCECAIDGIKR